MNPTPADSESHSLRQNIQGLRCRFEGIRSVFTSGRQQNSAYGQKRKKSSSRSWRRHLTGRNLEQDHTRVGALPLRRRRRRSSDGAERGEEQTQT